MPPEVRIVHPVCQPGREVRHHVAVPIQRDLHRRVAKELGHLLWVRSVLDQHAGVGVPQVVEAEGVEVSGQNIHHRLPEVAAVEGAVVERSAAGTREDVLVATEDPRPQMLPETVTESPVHEDDAPSRLRLRLPLDQAPFDPGR